MTDSAPPTQIQKLSAEFLGTFVLIFLGVGTAVILQAGSGDYAATGLAFGIAIVAMVYAFGRVSGGHFNPAVSVGAALAGRNSWTEALTYIGAQMAGALVGGFLLVITYLAADVGPGFGDDAWGANGFGDRGGAEVGGAILIELIMTFIFVFVIMAVTDKRNEVNVALAPLAIGLTLAGVHFASMGATGTSVNPARSFSTVLFSGGDAIVQYWVFLIFPLLGGALAGLLYPLIFGRDVDPVPGSGFSGGAKQNTGTFLEPQQQWGGTPAFGQHQAEPQQQWGQQQAQQQAAAQEPIIQDGWQWDPQAQQWFPANQPQADGGDRTQIRPPEGQ